ncbi:hypothetical protein ACTXT7_009659 [Hymenolepis weldensis]
MSRPTNMKTESSTCWYPKILKTAFETNLTASNTSIQKDEMSGLTAQEFHSASNLASKSIILDKNGQPISEKTVDGDEEEIQEALLHPNDHMSQIEHILRRQSQSERDMLSIIPLTNLLPGTNYTFEWSSANQFHLTTTLQFITATTPLTSPSKPTHFVFLVPTASHLRISVFLDDPCPYDNGGRAELSNILIRYRPVAQELGHASYRRGSEQLFGYGNWSETSVCLQNQDKESIDHRLSLFSQQQPPIKWSGDAEIQCDVEVKDPQANLEVAVATVNRFGTSPWVSSIYRASDALTSAYYQGSSNLKQIKIMYQVAILKEFIKEKVDEYLDHSESLTNSTTDLKKVIESPEFQHFRQKMLLDLQNMIQDREANATDDGNETQAIQTPTSSITDLEDNQSRPLHSELGSSLSTTITQDLGFFYPNCNYLTEMAQSLDPRISSTSKRRELLKQIIGMSSIETQVCDAWTICPETPTADRLSFDMPIRWSISKRSSKDVSSLYGIRQGIFDALVDDDIELNFRKLYLLHEFHKKLPNYWLRYSEKLTESLMDRCLSLLSVGHSPILEMTFEECENRLTPLHFFSIFDPKAQWFSLWMRAAYGCRPMLNRLAKNKRIKPGEDSLMNLVDKCFQRLAISPVANVPCFGLNMDRCPPSISRKNKRSSVHPNTSSQSDVSVIDIMLTEIHLVVHKFCAAEGVDKEYPISNNVCILTKALVNICLTVQGEEYFSHHRNARQKQIIIQILTSCLEFISSTKFEIFCKEDKKSVLNIAKIMDHVLIVFGKTHLSIKRRYAQSTIDFLRRVLDTVQFLKSNRKHARRIDEGILKQIEKSLNSLLLSLLKYPKGIELVESSGCLNNLVFKFICSSESTVAINEFELMVNQLSSSIHGFKFLNRNGFINGRFVEAWKFLEGSGIVDADQSQVVNYSFTDSLDVEMSTDNDTLNPIDQNDDLIQLAFNRLISVFANFTSVSEAVKDPVSRVKSTQGLQIAPRNLSDFIDRAIMLDSATKLAKLCRPDETLIFGLRFLSVMISSLNIFLLLESRFGIRSMLTDAQLRSSVDAEGGYSRKFMIDEGVIERNRLLVKCSVLGGPSERQLPPQCLCEHSADLYPYPIITSLNIDSFEPFINKSKLFCSQPPCIDSLDNHSVTSDRPIMNSFVSIVLSSLKTSSFPRVQADHDFLHKLPYIKLKIDSLAKHLPQLNKQTPDVGSLFDICLRINRGINQSVSSSVQPSSTSSTPQSWEVVAVNMIIEYGRRIKALNPTTSVNTQRNELSDMLQQIKTLTPSDKPLGKNFENNDSESKNNPDESFQTFDWFAALLFFIFNGDRSRTFEFLREFKETKLATFLWSSSVSSSIPQQYTLCHAFETIFACELPQLYNTFVLSGYSPSLDEAVNPRNDRWLLVDLTEVLAAMHAKFSATVMVFGFVSSEGGAHHDSSIFPQGLRVDANADAYVETLQIIVFRCWLHQCFLNYLDWSEIQDFFFICLLCGPEFTIYFAVAIMMHLSPRLRSSLQSQNHLVAILEKPIKNFRIVENLEFLESLAVRYGEQISGELSSASSADALGLAEGQIRLRWLNLPVSESPPPPTQPSN